MSVISHKSFIVRGLSLLQIDDGRELSDLVTTGVCQGPQWPVIPCDLLFWPIVETNQRERYTILNKVSIQFIGVVNVCDFVRK